VRKREGYIIPKKAPIPQNLNLLAERERSSYLVQEGSVKDWPERRAARDLKGEKNPRKSKTCQSPHEYEGIWLIATREDRKFF